MSRAHNTAKLMLGNGWYDRERISHEAGLSVSHATSTMQTIRRSVDYDTQEMKFNGKVNVKVLHIASLSKPSKEASLWRLALFGEQVA